MNERGGMRIDALIKLIIIVFLSIASFYIGLKY